MSQPRLRVVEGSTARAEQGTDPFEYQASCLDAYITTWVARSFSEDSITNTSGVLRRFLFACGRPAWEVTRDDVDRVVEARWRLRNARSGPARPSGTSSPSVPGSGSPRRRSRRCSQRRRPR